MDDDDMTIPDDVSELIPLTEVAYSPLSVIVDFNDLIIRYGQADAFRTLTRLKEMFP